LASPSISAQGAARLRPKYLLFAVILAMIAYVLGHNEHFLIDRADPFWDHIEPFKWWLLPHGMAGACAIFLGPMQFSDRLRQRFTKLHRVVGRIYVAGACILAPLGVYIQFVEEGMGASRSFTIAAAVDAVLLTSTTGIALFSILRGRIQQHRQWMTRSYSVALVFIEVRVISGLLNLDDAGFAVGELIVWICLAFSIPLADVVLQVQEPLRRAPVAARAG
jgi:uncharacterized membrane protein